METYEKKGYLYSDFRLFYLTDTASKEFEYHYHDFDKITIFLKGNVQYTIEGKSYQLQPYDIVLVSHNDIHKLNVQDSEPYERIVVYISKNTLVRAVNNLKHSFSDVGYANTLYQKILFLEFMIHLNRATLNEQLEFIDTDHCNTKVVELLQYINRNLTTDLNIDDLAARFYVSKYYMMRLFKTETGYTIGNYINYKRLLLAKELIASGEPITQACYDCGFKNYSTFSRAYKSHFGESPRQIRDTL